MGRVTKSWRSSALGYAVDLNQFLNQSFFTNFFGICHLKLQTAFAGSVGKCFDAAVVFVS